MTFQTTFIGAATAAVLAAACIATARAEPVVVDADAFPEGTDLGSAFPGVTLSVKDEPASLVLATGGFSDFNGRNLATTGERVFTQEPPPLVPLSWDENTGILRADFDQPTDFVQIDLICDDDDVSFLRAFDAADTLLEEVQPGQCDGRPEMGSPLLFTVSISRATADIAYMTAGGLGGEGLLLDNLQFGVELPACDLQLSQANYTDGEIVTADVLRLSNPSAVPMTVEMKVWFELPGQGPLQRVSVGDKSTLTLGAGFDQDLGPVPLLPVTPDLSRGDYEASCRLLNPARGTELSADMNPFAVE